MSGGFAADPAAIQAFAAVLADAQQQMEQIKARIEAPNAAAEHFGRSWQNKGEDYATYWGKLAPDLASLTSFLEQVQTNLAQGAKLMVAGETAQVGTFDNLDADRGSPEGSSTEPGGR